MTRFHEDAGRFGTTADYVLRTFAAVPVGQCVLELGGTRAGQAGPLTQLGFDVHVCSTDQEEVEALRAEAMSPDRIIHVARLDALGYPDAFFDWIVFVDAPGITIEDDDLTELLYEARRLLKPGGWIYAALSSSQSTRPQRLIERMAEANLVVAEMPKTVEKAGRHLVRGIFRRVDSGIGV